VSCSQTWTPSGLDKRGDTGYLDIARCRTIHTYVCICVYVYHIYELDPDEPGRRRVVEPDVHALAFTRYSFVDSAIVHESMLFLSLDTSGIAPPLYFTIDIE